MALIIGGCPELNTTTFTPRGANSKFAHHQTVPFLVPVELYPTHAKYGATPTASHTCLELCASTKGAKGNLKGRINPAYCSLNPLLRLHFCVSANPSGGHSTTPQWPCWPSQPILFGYSKPCHTTPCIWLQITQVNNLGACLLGTPGVGQTHSETTKLPSTP